MKKIFYFAIIFLAGLITACKKEKKPTVVTPPTVLTGPSKTGTTLQLIQDSVYLYAKEDYLWFTALPDYTTFQPRSFTNADDLTALTNELDKLSQYAINPATNLPYEYYRDAPGQAKYSFIDDGTVSAELNGVKGDFGFDVQYNLVNDLRIEYVYPGSPAGNAGLTRGCEIMSINGSTSISYDAPGFGTGTSTNLNYVSNAIYNSGTITMTVKTLSGTTVTVNLTTASYNVNPVLKDTILTEANESKLGYIVFNSFVSDQVADPLLDPIFANFASQGITDLVVDLRYNGGGYVETAEHIDNLIVPASKTNSLMYNTYYNSNLVNNMDPLLTNLYGPNDYSVSGNAVPFAKSGSLNVNRVFFIVTGQTASASELTINNLRPEMDVEFVGDTTYGKPVGFFAIDINKYEMFTPEFSVQNSANQGGYYAGFAPGGTGYPGFHDFDDLTKNFGDPTEGLLADILGYANTGTYAVTKQAIQSLNVRARNFSLTRPRKSNGLTNKRSFNGMVFNKKLKLKQPKKVTPFK
jgi:carboxyl-terminal processing protease